MKAYTDLSQSKKLAEILPPESADMDYIPVVNIDGEYSITVNTWDNDHVIEEGWIPCWSLATLLDLIPDIIEDYVLRIDKVDGEYFIWYDKIGEGWSDAIAHPSSENFIDAAFEMICWLKENKKI